MKSTRTHKNYPSWRQRDTRTLLFSLAVGAVTAAVTVGAIYFMNRTH